MRNARFYFIQVFILVVISSLNGISQSIDKCYFIKEINILGNEKTEKSIVLREISLTENTCIPFNLLEQQILESEINLMNTSLFHEVSIEKNVHNDSTVSICIILRERWYTWFWPLVEHPDRNLNAWLEHKDLTRLSGGIHFQQENFRGRREEVNIKVLAGYHNFINIDYEVPFVNRRKTWGLRIATLLGSQKEINYITTENSQRFFNYNEPLMKIAEIKIAAIYRPRLHFTHLFSIQHLNLRFHDTLKLLNEDYYGKINNPNFIGITYLFKMDFRDNRAYPENGFYMDSEFSFLSQTNSVYNQAGNRNSIRGYYTLRNKFLLATELAVKFTYPVRKPYYLQNALGFDRNYIRGYEYLVIEGPHYFIGKYNLRYIALDKKYLKIPFIHSTKFNTIPISIYAGPHFDMGITWPGLNEQSNPLQNKFLKGYGIGIDLVTYYDKVLRIEYTARNRNSSGFFIHFIASI